MPTFAYKAIDASGKSISGEIDGTDRRQVARSLQAQQYRPVSIVAREAKRRSRIGRSSARSDPGESRPIPTGSGRSTPRIRRRRGRSKIALDFLQKVLELVSSGMPLGDTVRLLSVRLTDPDLKLLANQLWKHLSEGRTLASAMRATPGYFQDSTVHLIEAGEASGNLQPILERIVAYLEEAAELRSRLLASLAYPLTVCTVAICVVVFFLVFLLPRIRSMLESLGGELQFFAAFLIGSADFFVRFGPFILFGVLMAGFSLLQWRKKPAGRAVTDSWLLRIPFIGRIAYTIDLFQTSSLMATLLSSGVNMTETLRLCERAIGNSQLRDAFSTCRQQIQEGASVAQTFRRNGFVQDMAADVLLVGENTGNLVSSLNHINVRFRKDLSQALGILTTGISTGALVFAFGFVTLIALAVIFSVIQISQSLQF